MNDITAKLERRTRDGYLVVTACTHTIGEQDPYFSVTAELWDSRGWYLNGQDGRCRACGCLHDEALRAFPKVKPIVDLHLSNALTGEPMHSLANGWYFYSGKAHEYEAASPYRSERSDTPLEHAARTLRVDPSELPEGLDEEGFTAFVDELRPRWKVEADAGRLLLSTWANVTRKEGVRV